MLRLAFFFAIYLLSALAEVARAEPTGTEAVAQKLLTTTVTVRSQRDEPQPQQVAQAQQPAAPQGQPQQQETRSQQALIANEGVTVSSGVSVRRGLVVTFNHPDAANEPQQVRYRVTLPDGEQTKAAVRVIDLYSGLSLLELEDRSLPALELSDTTPAVGAAILTAAASGIEKPLVSQGIVSGLDRVLGGTDLPPLIQCDVLSTDNSAGAAIADRFGKMVGVIVASSQTGQRGGWVYAVPVNHVQRLLDAIVVGRISVIQRRRPIAGLKLKAGEAEGTVEVEHVLPDGPADKAGIKQGDLVLEAQGRKIRSAYQAVDIITNRMPGDRMNFVVQQGEQKKSVDVTLGDSNTPKLQPFNQAQGDQQQTYVGPQVTVRNVGPNKYEVRSRATQLEQGQNSASNNENAPRRTDEVTMLRTQVEAFGRIIVTLQEDIRRRQTQEAEKDKAMEALRSEVDQLRRELTATRTSGGGAAPATKANTPARPAAK